MSLPISGFTAVPNPMMLSFLATQGFAIMYYGGAGWQFGKRKVSGMSNEEVNAMSPNEFLMKLHSETKTMVPTMQQGMKDMTPLITTTIEQFGSYIREAIAAFPQAVSNIVGGGGGEFSNIPTTQGQGQGQPSGSTLAFIHYLKALSDATKKGTVAGDITGNKLTFHDTLTQEFKDEAAREQKRFERDKELLFAKTNAQIRQTARTQDVSKFQKRRGVSFTKRKAGQSQKLERSRLITNINKQRGYLKVFNKLPKPLSTVHKAKRDRILWHINDSQKRLAILVQRYQF